jgi:hypothetical protein
MDAAEPDCYFRVAISWVVKDLTIPI